MAAFGTLLTLACGDETSAPTPNQPPLTQVTGGPQDGAGAASHVTFNVLGSDYDGTARVFDYVIDTYPRSVAALDQVVKRPPIVDDPRWQRTTTNQIVLVVAADTLRADPSGDIGAGLFDRWHTFYVRSVDNEGAVDATPESRTFQAFTQAPSMRLLSPAVRGQTSTVPRTFLMNWDGFDPIGQGEPYQDPIEVRWVLLPATLDGGGQPIGFPAALYALPEAAWSAWAAWTDPDSAGREKAFVNQVQPGAPATAFVFALQGRDDAGAVTPKFDAATASINNFTAIIVDGSLRVGPRITVHALEDSLSSWTFDGAGAPQINVMTTSDRVTLEWDPPRASHYGARTNGCRYGWNIVDTGNDAEWTAWSTARFAPPQTLSPTGDVFRIQCRDQLDQITEGVLVFQPIAPSAAGERRSKNSGPR
jgi:hypothetical protein